MSLASRSLERSLAPQRARYAREVDGLMGAALRVLRRKGYAAATVADVLAQARLSTRAFYRHFRSKDELFLAVFEHDSRESSARMLERLAAVPEPLERLAAWVDEVLSLAYEPRRARRTRTFVHEAAVLRADHPAEFVSLAQAVQEPLLRILEQGRAAGAFPAAEPEVDTASIRAVTWSLVEARFAGGGAPDAAAARAQVLRFCLPALGVDLARARRHLAF
jgi:AcrR family transcriptional regulator